MMKKWANYTCIFCDTHLDAPAEQEEALREATGLHMLVCKKHPMREVEQERDEQLERVEQLEGKLEMTQAAREQAESLAEGLRHDRDGQLDRLEKSERDRDSLRDNLREYGEHQPPCPRYDSPEGACSCGFDAALETAVGVGSGYDPSPPPGSPGEVKP